AYREYSSDIHNSGIHLLGLINEILDLSRIEAGRYVLKEESVSLVSIVEIAITFSNSAPAMAESPFMRCSSPRYRDYGRTNGQYVRSVSTCYRMRSSSLRRAVTSGSKEAGLPPAANTSA